MVKSGQKYFQLKFDKTKTTTLFLYADRREIYKIYIHTAESFIINNFVCVVKVK